MINLPPLRKRYFLMVEFSRWHCSKSLKVDVKSSTFLREHTLSLVISTIILETNFWHTVVKTYATVVLYIFLHSVYAVLQIPSKVMHSVKAYLKCRIMIMFTVCYRTWAILRLHSFIFQVIWNLASGFYKKRPLQW